MQKSKQIKTISLQISVIIFIVFMQCFLIGCGKKGPLYIPEQRYPQKAKPQVPSNASESAQKP